MIQIKSKSPKSFGMAAHTATALSLCASMEKDLPSDVDFKYLPAVFGRGWLAHAKAFYVADLLGMEDKIRADLFNAIHVERRNLNFRRRVGTLFCRLRC